jgi:EmrB/QacA subfamily drug resistance transporter
MTDATPAGLTRQQKVITMTGVMLGVFLAALDQTVVSTAGPAIQEDLALPTALYEWLTLSYMVASTAMVPIYGKLSDIKGRKPVLLAGILIFLAGSVGCGLAGTWPTLLVMRAVQGLGSAALFTTAFAVIADLFPPSVRGKYTGIFGAVWTIASVVGPLVGGLLTEYLSWHWVFFVNLPIGALSIAFVALRMPRLGGGVARGLDIPGMVALVTAVVPLIIALSLGRGQAAERVGEVPVPAHWGDPVVLGLFALAAVGALAFVAIEARADDPILDLKLFRTPIFAWGNAAVFVCGAVFFAGVVYLPLFLIRVVGVAPTAAGLSMTPLTLGLVIGNVVSGQVVSRVGRYKGLLVGSLVALVGAYAMMGLTLDEHATLGAVTLKMIVIGVALGPSLPIYTLAIQNGMGGHQVGVVTATVTFSRQIGSTIGLALLGTVFASLQARVTTPGLVGFQLGITSATRGVFWVGAGMAVLAVALTLMVPALPLRRHH